MIYKLSESAVGKVGRTGKTEAEVFVQNNPELIKKFKKIVSQIGGKAVAAQILNLKLFGKPAAIPKAKIKIRKQPGEK
jgi:hypothetical protein